MLSSVKSYTCNSSGAIVCHIGSDVVLAESCGRNDNELYLVCVSNGLLGSTEAEADTCGLVGVT